MLKLHKLATLVAAFAIFISPALIAEETIQEPQQAEERSEQAANQTNQEGENVKEALSFLKIPIKTFV